MARTGTIQQIQGPISSDQSSYSFGNSCVIGISISEDDFMAWPHDHSDKGFSFQINGQQIQMGRTFIYETGQNLSGLNTVVSFPYGAPQSLLMEVLHHQNN